MYSEAKHQPTEPVGQLSLWISILGGASAWALHLVFAYALVPLACATGSSILLYAIIPLFILLAAVSTFLGWRGWRMGSAAIDDPEDANHLVANRVRFMGLSGVVMSGFFLFVIIAQSVPILANNPCDPAGSIRI